MIKKIMGTIKKFLIKLISNIFYKISYSYLVKALLANALYEN